MIHVDSDEAKRQLAQAASIGESWLTICCYNNNNNNNNSIKNK